jgi:hypothetical protein
LKSAFSFTIHLNLRQNQQMNNEYVLVEKEEVAQLTFPKAEVLVEEHDRKRLRSELDRAMALGNLEHHKVKIYFEDDKKKRVVHTTIWVLTDKAIVLKKNIILPLNRIYKLEI